MCTTGAVSTAHIVPVICNIVVYVVILNLRHFSLAENFLKVRINSYLIKYLGYNYPFCHCNSMVLFSSLKSSLITVVDYIITAYSPTLVIPHLEASTVFSAVAHLTHPFKRTKQSNTKNTARLSTVASCLRTQTRTNKTSRV